MAVGLLSHKVSDLCLGKPPVLSIPADSTVGDALIALRNSRDGCVSVWICRCCCFCDRVLSVEEEEEEEEEGEENKEGACRCVGKLCMVDVICYLSEEKHLLSPSAALRAPVSVLLPKSPARVAHVDANGSLLEAIDLILKGAQTLVVPIQRGRGTGSRRKLHPKQTPEKGHHQFCWLTSEDIIRFLLNSIGILYPLPARSIDSLGIITSETLTVGYHSPASSALEAIRLSHANQTSVAVVDGDNNLIGEISPYTLACCEETVAAAIAVLSCGDLMAYIDCGGPPEDMVRVVEARLKERDMEGFLEEFSMYSESSNSLSSSLAALSSDEEFLTSPGRRSLSGRGKYNRSLSYSARMVRRSEAIVCQPRSSLVAVMIQAIAHRVNYVWVIEDDGSLAGMVTFSSMLEVFREHLQHLTME
ncbi:hypothetical protein MLD38_012668 [Melastoma candidum]|uniref:Uncharacterized protein n=1 Tax=Melastoma candidum TaxID=119954 RepID=A0ACB9R7M4_9MYRT|nr:hypothetical protein MLD38_012668 [Melastoma candidum]